jgi:hypothetical protein
MIIKGGRASLLLIDPQTTYCLKRPLGCVRLYCTYSGCTRSCIDPRHLSDEWLCARVARAYVLINSSSPIPHPLSIQMIAECIENTIDTLYNTLSQERVSLRPSKEVV